jgi:hypothetical protein
VCSPQLCDAGLGGGVVGAAALELAGEVGEVAAGGDEFVLVAAAVEGPVVAVDGLLGGVDPPCRRAPLHGTSRKIVTTM